MVVASERCIPRSAPSVALIPWFPSCPVATDQWLLQRLLQLHETLEVWPESYCRVLRYAKQTYSSLIRHGYDLRRSLIDVAKRRETTAIRSFDRML